jgi:hypothetical protein
MKMEPFEPTAPVAVTLQAQQWNGVIAALVKAPWEMADPLIRQITAQVASQAPKSPAANGAAQAEAADAPH